MLELHILYRDPPLAEVPARLVFGSKIAFGLLKRRVRMCVVQCLEIIMSGEAKRHEWLGNNNKSTNEQTLRCDDLRRH